MNDTKEETAPTLDRQLCFAVYGAAHAFNRAYKPLLEPLGLTYPQYLVMMVLWEEDTQSVKAIGDRLGLDSGTLSPLLKRLEQAGYVVRKRCSDDERQVLVSLTETGTGLRRRACDVMQSIGKATGCTRQEIENLRNRLQDLRHQLTPEE
ncbi:MAG: MarR family transcriptional regulator [Rhizobium sp.]|jgi:DNA-binding MarR family transcriptional regulator